MESLSTSVMAFTQALVTNDVARLDDAVRAAYAAGAGTQDLVLAAKIVCRYLYVAPAVADQAIVLIHRPRPIADQHCALA